MLSSSLSLHALRCSQVLGAVSIQAAHPLSPAMWKSHTRPSWEVQQRERLEGRRAAEKEKQDAWRGSPQKWDKDSWRSWEDPSVQDKGKGKQGEWWQGEERATDHSKPFNVLKPPRDAEPTAISWEVTSPGQWMFPKRNPEEDLSAFRDVAMTPSNFVP